MTVKTWKCRSCGKVQTNQFFCADCLNGRTQAIEDQQRKRFSTGSHKLVKGGSK